MCTCSPRANARRVADVDKSRQGLFIFNYFVGDDPEVVVQLWDYLAGWYEVETGLTTPRCSSRPRASKPTSRQSTTPDGTTVCRGSPGRQFTKKTFGSYMKANLAANYVGSMPVLYRLVPR